jgi:hypothetical protein
LVGINPGKALELEIVNAPGVGVGQADFLQAAIAQVGENERCRGKVLRVVSAHGASFAISGSDSRHSCSFPFHVPSAARELSWTKKENAVAQILPYFDTTA